jgi:predicted DNA-binding transcriptional regulator AlpA
MSDAATIQPRLLSRDEAAVYVGLSPNAFDAEVAAGTFPAPFKLAKIRRLLWDVRALDLAMDRAMTEGVPENDWTGRKERWKTRREGRAQGAR